MSIRNTIAAGLIMLSIPATALEQLTGHVILVEPSYMPTKVTFQMDTSSASCAAGTYFTWQSQTAANNEAVYTSLLTALLSGKKINFFVDDGDTTCKGRFIHLLNQE